MNRTDRASAFVAALWLAVFTSACATIGGLKDSEGDGQTRYYRADRADLLSASVIALSEGGLTIAEINEDASYVLAEAEASASSYGEVVGVFVSRSAGDSTVLAVRVVSRRRLATNLFARNWEGDVLDRLDVQLPADALMLGSSADVPPPAISPVELDDCLAAARDAGRVITDRERNKDVRDCQAEGAGDSDATLACFERKRREREEAGYEPDMDVLNTCLAQERKDVP